MIRSIKELAYRFFKANKFIAFSSVLSVMLSISLIITMAVFAGNAQQSLENEVKKMFGDMDLSVGYNPEQNKIIDQSFLHHISSQESIQHYSRVLITRFKVDQLNADVYTVGAESDSLAKSRYQFSQDLASDEVIMNEGLAEALGVQVGDSTLIENKPYMVKEVITDLEAAGLTIDKIILSRSTVQQLIYEKTGVNNEATYLLIKAKKDTDIIGLANQIRQIDPDLRIDVAEENEFLNNNLQSLKVFMIVLSVLVLIVTSLLIISNFEAFLYKYKNQFAIMRSVGATTDQIFKVVWIQSSVINLAGAGLGLLLALISHQFFQKGLERLFSFKGTVMDFHYMNAIVAMLISVSIIQIFMLIPSYRSAKVLPLKIMQDNEQNDFSHKRLRTGFGKGLLYSGIFLIIIGIISDSGGSQALTFLLAALLLVFGMFKLFPVYLSPILIRLLPVMKILLGKVSYVAVKNLIPQVRKNTFVVLTISTMMIIAVFGSALFMAIQTNDERYLKEQYVTPIVVKSRLYHDSTINPYELQATIKDMASVQGASTLSTFSSAYLNQGNKFTSISYGLADLKEMEKQGLFPLLPDQVDNIIIVTRGFAEKYKLKVGDHIELGLYSEPAQKVLPTGTVLVSNIAEELPGSGSSIGGYMDWQNTTYSNRFTAFNRVFIDTNDVQSTLNQLQSLKRQYPELQVNSYDQSMEMSKQMFYQRWSIFIIVIIVMLLSVILGVFNTLINNIHSKRKEFAILRAMSVDKKGIIQVILTQVVLYILIGLILGVVAGMLLTYVLSLMDTGTVYFDFTFISIIAAVMLGIAFLIFTPFASSIGLRNISTELTQDNK